MTVPYDNFRRISPQEYLKMVLAVEVRHEYLNGYVHAKPDENVDHNRILGNIAAALLRKLRRSSYEPFASSMMVKSSTISGEAFYYPDVFVTPYPDDNEKYFRERPSIIFEIVSPATERIDRGEKWMAYFKIPTVHTYVLVEQDKMLLTVLHREQKDWRAEIIEGPKATLNLSGINVKIPLKAIYDRTSISKTLKSR